MNSFGCQSNNHFQMIFLSFADKISPCLFLKYLLYKNTFTYLFSPFFSRFPYRPFLNHEKYPFFRVRLQLQFWMIWMIVLIFYKVHPLELNAYIRRQVCPTISRSVEFLSVSWVGKLIVLFYATKNATFRIHNVKKIINIKPVKSKAHIQPDAN